VLSADSKRPYGATAENAALLSPIPSRGEAYIVNVQSMPEGLPHGRNLKKQTSMSNGVDQVLSRDLN
jgi:hypothetical protein